MQEEITQKTLALCVEASKMTAQLLQQAMKKVLADMEKHKKNPQLRHGKQTLRQLMKHNTGVSNIEITDQNIRAFSSTAKKYGLDFALKKDTSGEHTRYLVFFKGRRKPSRSPASTAGRVRMMRLTCLSRKAATAAATAR